MLTNDASFSSDDSPHHAVKEAKKKKWVSMMGLKMYTGSCTKKSRRDSNKFKGWLEEGKVFIVKMMNYIKKDVDSGVHGEWEKMYRKSTKVMKVTNEKDQEGKSRCINVDYSAMYCEL
jgi:hypothetical protein